MVLCLSANPLFWAEIQFRGSKGGLGHLLTFSNEDIEYRRARAYHVMFLTDIDEFLAYPKTSFAAVKKRNPCSGELTIFQTFVQQQIDIYTILLPIAYE